MPEVLAALAVFALLLVVLANGVRFGQQAVRAGDRAARAGDDLGQADHVLRELIAHARAGGPGAGESRFAGSARTLSFRTTLPSGLADPRTRAADVTIAVDANHRLAVLWRPWIRNRIASPPPPGRAELLANVERVEFAYWDSSLNTPPGAWAAAWDGAAPPRLVRLRLIPAPGSGARWPDIIAATKRDARVN